MNKTRLPQQKRSMETYERLLAVSQEILEDVGIEGFNSNLIVERLGMTPPTFYRYFSNKYDVLKELGERLMAAQNELVTDVPFDPAESAEDLIQDSKDSLKASLEVTRAFKGGYMLLVSLRASPELRSVRLKSHDEMARVIADRVRKLGSKERPAALMAKARLSIEIGYGAIEMLFETNFKNEDVVLDGAARAMITVLGVT